MYHVLQPASQNCCYPFRNPGEGDGSGSSPLVPAQPRCWRQSLSWPQTTTQARAVHVSPAASGTAWCVWRLTWRRVPQASPWAAQQQTHIHPESTCWAMCTCHRSFHQQTRQLGFGYENATSGCVGWDPQKDRLTSPANSCKDSNEAPCLKKKKVNSESRILDARVMDMH